MWDQIWQELQINHDIIGLVYVVTCRTNIMYMLPCIPHVCGCMGKVWQVWPITNTLGSCSSKPQSTQAVGPDIWWELQNHQDILRIEYYVVQQRTTGYGYILPPIPYNLWVHGQGLTSLGHNQYTRILFIQASVHPSCGTRYLVGTAKPPCHHQDGVCCKGKNHRPRMYCHSFHIFYVCMEKV